MKEESVIHAVSGCDGGSDKTYQWEVLHCDIYLITRVSVQYRELLHEWAWYFHEPKASENAVHECNNRDMHANECNKIFIIHYHNSVASQLTQTTE